MKLLKEEIIVTEDRLTHNGDLEILYPGELDHYKTICKTKDDVSNFDFQSDYWGDANEYRSKALREFSRISYYIGKTVSLKDDFGDTQEIIINGLVIDRQYNSNLGIAATDINSDSLDEDLEFRR